MKKEQYQLITAGGLSTGKYLKVLAPYDGREIGEVEIADEKVAQTALASAHQAFVDKKKWLKPHERIAIIEKAVQMIKEEADYLSLEAARGRRQAPHGF